MGGQGVAALQGVGSQAVAAEGLQDLDGWIGLEGTVEKLRKNFFVKIVVDKLLFFV